MWLACWDLSRATLTLETHHDDEKRAFDEALAALRESSADLPVGREAVRLRADEKRLQEIAAKLRNARDALVAELVGMRIAIEDVVQEERALRPSGGPLLPDRPNTTRRAPRPSGGSVLTPLQTLSVLNDTVRWSREVSYSQAAAALGPCYLLAKIIEYPKPPASGLRDIAQEACDHLGTFLHSAYGW